MGKMKDGDRLVAQLISKARMQGVDYLRLVGPMYWMLYVLENRN